MLRSRLRQPKPTGPLSCSALCTEGVGTGCRGQGIGRAVIHTVLGGHGVQCPLRAPTLSTKLAPGGRGSQRWLISVTWVPSTEEAPGNRTLRGQDSGLASAGHPSEGRSAEGPSFGKHRGTELRLAGYTELTRFYATVFVVASPAWYLGHLPEIRPCLWDSAAISAGSCAVD